jgi:hypothetical protein
MFDKLTASRLRVTLGVIGFVLTNLDPEMEAEMTLLGIKWVRNGFVFSAFS